MELTYKIFIFFVYCTFYTGIVLAQNHPESNQHTVYYVADSIDASLRNMAFRQPVWMADAVKDNYNELSLTGNLDKGGLIPEQGSTKTQRYGLNTSGKTTWNNIHIAGYFAYKKSLEDSTRWRHQTRINETAPFYFGSIKKNHYERSVYQLGATLHKNWMSEHIPTIASIYYRVGEHFSNNDPRGSLNDFQFNSLLSSGYNLKHWQYRGSLRLGYGRERTQVAFKNELYSKNTSDPLYVNWMMNGYGYSQIYISDINYNDDMKLIGIGAHAAYRPDSSTYMIFNLTTDQQNQDFKHYEESITGFTLLNAYKLSHTDLELLFGSTWASNRRFLVTLHLRATRGKDFNEELLVNNYLYNENTGELTLRSSLNRYQVQLGATIREVNKQDGNMGNDIGTANLRVWLSGGRRILFSQNKSLNVQLRAGQVFPLSDHLIINSLNENDFSRYVIYHDYLYNTASISNTGVSIEYDFLSSKNSTIGIGLTADYNWLTSGIEPMEGALSIPGNDLFSGMLQLKLYF